MGNTFTAPVINDVSTDIDDPPTFNNSRHAATLPDSFKSAITRHYSHLKPLRVQGGDPAAVFAAARRAVAALPRATIVSEDATSETLELVDVTALMKFKDDVSVRVRSVGGEVVVDVRSASRVGKGDLGKNAERIEQYLAALKSELGRH